MSTPPTRGSGPAGRSTWSRLQAAHAATRRDGTGQAPSHEPMAAVLACSDARVPPSVIFDQPAGALFVVRIAGNTASPAAVASLAFAVAELGVDLIVVLGHTSCGAVKAAVDGICGEPLAPVVAPICEVARTMPDAAPDCVAAENVAATVRRLAEHDGPIGEATSTGRLEIVGALHDLASGRLLALTDPPANQPSPEESCP